MPYAVPDDVRGVLAGSELLAGTAASLTDTDLVTAIDEAQQEVDGRLAARYAVPFTDPPPAVVASVTRDIAAWLATLTWRRGEPIAATEPAALRYQRAEGLLGQLASGNLSLDVDPAPVAASQAAVANRYDGDLFGPDDFGLGPAPAGWGRWPDRAW